MLTLFTLIFVFVYHFIECERGKLKCTVHTHLFDYFLIICKSARKWWQNTHKHFLNSFSNSLDNLMWRKTKITYLIVSWQMQSIQTANSSSHLRIIAPKTYTVTFLILTTHLVTGTFIRISWLFRANASGVIVITMWATRIFDRVVCTNFGCCTIRRSVSNCFRRIYALAIWLFCRLIWRLLMRMSTVTTCCA